MKTLLPSSCPKPRIPTAGCAFVLCHLSAAAKIQVVTLVHVYMAARASLLNIQTQYEEVVATECTAASADVGPELGYDAPDWKHLSVTGGRQAAILELAGRVISRWADQTDLVVVGGDWNTSTRPRAGYVGSQVTRGADARLQEWYRRKSLACAAPEHATCQSSNETRHAVLDCFFWRSKSDGLSIRGAEAFLSADRPTGP